ncbi:hypothetical protein, partial [Sphingomonas sp. Leaf32]
MLIDWSVPLFRSSYRRLAGASTERFEAGAIFEIVDEMKGHVGGGLRLVAFKVSLDRLKSSRL